MPEQFGIRSLRHSAEVSFQSISAVADQDCKFHPILFEPFKLPHAVAV